MGVVTQLPVGAWAGADPAANALTQVPVGAWAGANPSANAVTQLGLGLWAGANPSVNDVTQLAVAVWTREEDRVTQLALGSWTGANPGVNEVTQFSLSVWEREAAILDVTQLLAGLWALVVVPSEPDDPDDPGGFQPHPWCTPEVFPAPEACHTDVPPIVGSGCVLPDPVAPSDEGHGQAMPEATPSGARHGRLLP